MSWVKRSGGGAYRANAELFRTSDPTVFGGPKAWRAEDTSGPPSGLEPYVRVSFPVQDAKAMRWTRTHVLVQWPDDAHHPVQAWVPASWVQRIPREQSSWTDPYDRHDR